MPTSVTRAEVFAAFLDGAGDLVRELVDWRQFGQDVVEFLRARGLESEFHSHQEHRARVRAGAPEPREKKRARRR